jgi:hypothetical protein
MSTDCFFLNPLLRDGTSQRQRAVPALDPAWARIDERGLADLLVYARDFARLLRYYTPSNSAAGDWTELIENDATALVALLRHEDAAAVKAAFATQVAAVAEAAAADVLAEYAELFAFVLQPARTIDRWHGAFERDLAVWRDLDRLVRSALNDALRDALVVSLRVHEVDAGIETIEAAVAALGPAWDMSSVEPDTTAFPNGKPVTDEDRDEALHRLQRVFDRFYEAQVFLARNTGRYLRETLVEYPRHEPHMALFLAFLRLFRHAQHHLNGLGAKHLDFYFEEVLRLRHEPAAPDSAHLVLELAKNAEPQRVTARTQLSAGKDAAGIELIYATDEELVVNRAVIDAEHGLKTIFVERDAATQEVIGIHAAPDADSGDGLGADLTDEDGKWATLGGTAMPFAELGFAIASPMFRLSEGKREIKLKFRLRAAVASAGTAVSRELERNVRVAFTGDGGWVGVPTAKVAVSFANGNRTLVYTLTVDPELGPILRHDAKVHAGGFVTRHPVMRFLLDVDALSAATFAALDAQLPAKAPVSTADLGITDYADEVEGYGAGSTVRHQGRLYRNVNDIDDAGARPGVDPRWTLLQRSYAYRHLEGLRLDGLDIELDVEGIRSLILENDVGVLDASKPFLPFGPLPKVGGSFLIGSTDVFHKPVSWIKLTVDWADLPTAAQGFKQHYGAYSGGPANNQHFKARVGVLDGGAWRDPVGGSGAKSLTLFRPTGTTPLTARAELDFSLDPLERADAAKPFARFGTGLRQGFMRLQLGQSFLHSQYPQELAAAIAEQNTTTHPIPAAPYTPLISFLALDFEAAAAIDWGNLSKTDYAARAEQLFQVGPFGPREVFPIDADPTAAGVPVDQHVVPQFRVTVTDDDDQPQVLPLEGALLIGIAHLQPPQNLTILIRVAEGSEDPRGRAPQVVWSYAGNDEWVDFADTEVLADGTGGLLRSGIVRLAIPKKATRAAAYLPGGLHWLRAAVAEETRAVPKAVALHTQAVTATFVDRGNDSAHLATALPAGTIAKLKHRDAAIKSVTQPYSSFGGRLPEGSRAFRVRVSERLRHKGRAVAIFDYERLVLQEFPEVYKVKCLNHSTEGSEHAPGHVKLVVVPDLRNQNAVDPLRPRFSLGKLDLIAQRLRQVASDFITIEVANPSYEAVRADFAVRFHKGFDRGLYTRQLQQDLVKFLSPWLYDEAADLTFGGRVHRSAILNWVEELGYVDFVTDFKLEQVLEDGEELRDLEEARATTSSAALVSAVDHAISHATGSCVDHV